MVKGAISKYIIFIICLSLSFMVFLGSPFIYAAEITDEPFDVKSSPVGSTDLTKSFNFNADFSYTPYLRTNNNSVNFFGSATAAGARNWLFSGFPPGFRYDSFYALALFDEGLTLVNNYRYLLKIEVLFKSTYSESGNSFDDASPLFCLYSEFTDSGDYISNLVSPTKVVQSDGARRTYYFDFVFDANSLIVNPFKGDSPTLNEDGTYSFSGFGFYLRNGNTDEDLTSFNVVWYEREAYVFSPEDYMAYYTLSNLWGMGVEQSDWVDESVDNATIEAGNALDGLGELVLPDLDEASGYADPFSKMDSYWFSEFGRVLSPIIDNPLISTLIILAAMFCMLSYVLFGKRV